MPALVSTAHNLRETSEKGGPTWYKEMLYRVTDFLADRTTIICQAAFDRYVEVRAVPPEKFEVVPNGIDIHQFSNSSKARATARSFLGLGDSSFIWLAVGRLVEQKDYSTLLAAVRNISTPDFQVLIAGQGPLLDSLRAECRELGLEQKIRFLGTTENMRQLYAAADGFVMSSVFEGLSAALLEASAMTLPAVVTAVGGNTEIVTDSKTGYVVPPSDAVSLGEAMARLMNLSSEARHSFGQAARKHCVETFSFDIVVGKWIELYSSCLSRGSAMSTKTAGVAMSSISK